MQGEARRDLKEGLGKNLKETWSWLETGWVTLFCNQKIKKKFVLTPSTTSKMRQEPEKPGTGGEKLPEKLEDTEDTRSGRVPTTLTPHLWFRRKVLKMVA